MHEFEVDTANDIKGIPGASSVCPGFFMLRISQLERWLIASGYELKLVGS
jgi:hypothetical protein